MSALKKITIDPKEEIGLYAIETIEKALQTISARSFLAVWEVAALMRGIAYNQAIEIVPSASVATAIQLILNMMTTLRDKTLLTVKEICDLIGVVC